MTKFSQLKQQIIGQFGTPCAVVDLDIVEQNIEKAQLRCESFGLANRPHVKTHKSPFLAKKQIIAGAQGITCQKIGEAEVMVDAGITDIIVATNVLGAARSGRLLALQKRVSIKYCADSFYTLKAYLDAAKAANRPLEVLIECDTDKEQELKRLKKC